MIFHDTPLDNVKLVEFELRGDERGSFARTFCEAEFAAAGIPMRIVQANTSRNADAFTLRGLHFQRVPHAEAKFVRCIRGRLFDVAVDIRPDSPTYLMWFGAELSGTGNRSLYLGEGTAHGYLTLEPDSELSYMVSATYMPEAESGLRWDDPAVGIQWPAVPLIISERDRTHPLIGG